MTVGAIAKRDFLNVRRAKLVWAPAAFYTLFMVLFFWGQSEQEDPEFYNVLWSFAGIGGALVIPLIALVAAYLAIAGERESGTIKFTLGLPVDRRDVVIGKLLARTGIVFAGILISFAVGLVTSLYFVPQMGFEYDALAMFTILTLLYALAYVAVAIGLSAWTSSRSRAMGAAIGFFFVFNVGWNFLPVQPAQMVQFVLDRFDISYSQHVLEFIWSLSPVGAYLNGMQLVVPPSYFRMNTDTSAGMDPFYVEGWFMFVILTVWIILPLVLGYWRFTRADLA